MTETHPRFGQSAIPACRSDDVLHTVFEHANDAIFVLDPQRDRILDANPKACSLLGYSHEDLLAIPISAVHPKEMPELLAFARSVFNEGSGWTDRLTCLTSSGTRLPSEISASAVDIAGRPCLIALVRVVDHKKADQVLRDIFAETAAVTGEAFFRSLVRHLASALGVRYALIAELAPVPTRARTLAFWTGTQFLESFDYSLVDGPCGKVLSGEVLHCPDNVQVLFPKSPLLPELEVVSYLGFPLRDSSGQVLGHLAVMDDKPMPAAPLEMSVFRIFAERARAELERERMEQALRKREEQLRVLANSLPVLIAYVDAAGRYQFNNLAYEKWFNQPAEAFKGRHIGEVIDGATYAVVQPYVQRALSGQPQRFELELHHHTLGVRSVEMHYAPHREPEGRVAGYYALGMDITDRKRAEQSLVEAKQAAEAANRAKTEFLANLSHELRTPLNGILGYAQVLKKRALADEQRDTVGIIQQSGEYLLNLINDLLDLSKIEAGRLGLNCGEFHLPEFLRVIAETMRVRAEGKGLRFVYKPTGPLPAGVRCDEKRLRQVLINLLGNAIKFTDQGSVYFRVGHDQGRIQFEIEDTGIGIPVDRLEEIFLPFRQIAPPDQSSEGSGLGLAICKRLTDALGGELSVQSTPGEGSLFRLALDLPEVVGFKNPVRADSEEITGYRGSRIKVLVVDDKPDNRLLLRQMLEPLGFTIAEAGDGEEALTKAAEWRPEVILMDLVMPVLDGFEATRRLRRIAQLKDVIVIGISASAFEQDQQGSLEAGCNDFLAKPVHTEDLLQCLQRHLHLEWQYEAVPNPLKQEEYDSLNKPAAEPVVTPPDAVLGSLRELADIGDIQGILEAVVGIEQSDARFKPFAHRLRDLARAFEIGKIRELLARPVTEQVR